MVVDNNIEISEEGDYETKTLSLKGIVLRHLKKISDICCKEFIGGYWQKRPVKTPGGIMFIEEYHEDVRESYCNAVDFLIDILYPDSDKEFKKYIDSNEKVEDKKEDTKIEISKKLVRKRKTFRQINKMFERTNYFRGTGIESE